MKVDAGIGSNLKEVLEMVARLESLGYDGIRTAEMNHDPFFPLVLAAEHSQRLELATSIAVAFARSPMNLANLGHDLNAYSQGRFTLGLGSQIKPHITKRFSMQWGAPAAQMRELILAMRAIWSNWYDSEPLEFVGEYYRHTLMTPAFSPQDKEFGAPRVVLAAVGPKMTEVAGEVADGMIIHPFSTLPYIESVTMPAIERGIEKSGRSRADFELSYSCFVITGRDEEEYAKSKQEAQQRVAFYGSTPAYKGVLESIGVGELQSELNAMSKQGRWVEMGSLITDDILQEFGVMGAPETIAGQMIERYGSFVDRTSASFPISDDKQRAEVIAALRAG